MDLLKAIAEPSPAKTKISIEINSARAALRASRWTTSAGRPTIILTIAIFEGILDFLLAIKLRNPSTYL